MTKNKQILADFGINQLEKITLIDGRLKVEILNLGASIYSLEFPDANGKIDDLVLGYPTWQQYLTNNDMFGCIAGRYANRIENAKFSLNGKVYYLPINNGKNCLHGGDGIHLKFFKIDDYSAKSVTMSTFSSDGEQGFPGNLNVSVNYLLENETVKILLKAYSDQDTVINLTNHSYFNLAGHNSGSIIEHIVELPAEQFLAINENLIPTQFLPVTQTPFDFNQPTVINRPLGTEHPQIKLAGGVDHYYLSPHKSLNNLACKVFEPYSGRCIEAFTNQPGVQFYTANHIDGIAGKYGAYYGKYPAFCIEAQKPANAPNRADFPLALLKAGEFYTSETHYKFSLIN